MHASSTNDPYYLLEARNRWLNYYPGPPFYYPTLYVDGTDAGWPTSLWEPAILARMDQPSPMTLTMWGTYNEITLNGTIYAKFRNDSTASITSRIYFVITEDSLYYLGSNGDAWHNHVARDYLPDETGEEVTIAAGDSITVSRSFTIGATWDEDKCEIVTWIQNENTRETYQGSKVNLMDLELIGVEEDFGSELSVRPIKPAPNPCVDGTQFTFTLPIGTAYKIALFDISGRQIKTITDITSQNTESINWNLQDDNGVRVSSGIYFYRFVSNETHATGKLVVR
jgi:hypothetical protein